MFLVRKNSLIFAVLAMVALLILPSLPTMADEFIEETPTVPTVPRDPTTGGGPETPEPSEEAETPETTEVFEPSRGGINWPLEGLLQFAQRDIDAFWTKTFDQLDLRYFPLTEVSGYTRAITTACGQARLNNAFYCGRSHSIHFDTNFLSRVQRQIGSFAVVTVIAHEWAHAVQAMVGGLSIITIQNELQADCLAGVYAQSVMDSPLWSPTEILVGAQFLALVGDEEEVSFTTPGAHGSAGQRRNAFLAGFELGIERCFVHF
jgi:predicted metalloprotease